MTAGPIPVAAPKSKRTPPWQLRSGLCAVTGRTPAAVTGRTPALWNGIRPL